MTVTEERVLLAAAALAGLVLLAAAKKSPGASMKVPEFSETPLPFTAPPGAPVLGPDEHTGGIVYTPHRYPPACGADITTLIHRGWSTVTLPGEGDMLWLAAPPSEADL